MKIHVYLMLAVAIAIGYSSSAEAQYAPGSQHSPGNTPLWNNYSHEVSQPTYSLASVGDQYGEPGLLQPTSVNTWADETTATGGGCDSCGDAGCGGCGNGWGLGKCVERCGCWSATCAGLYL
ncbi:MAG: hypothetical protein N2B03_07115, partial [Boseongicola sp.]